MNKKIFTEFLKSYSIKRLMNERDKSNILENFSNFICLYEKDKKFNEIFNQIRYFVSLDSMRCFMLYQLLKSVLMLDGDVAEAGVFKGGSAKLLASVISLTKSKKSLHLFDTFEGMPKTYSKKDSYLRELKKKVFSDTSLDAVKRFLEKFDNIVFYKGNFKNTFRNTLKINFCFVHVDCDFYKSTKLCCEFFYPRLVSNGVMVFDDYSDRRFQGVKQAVDNFFMKKSDFKIFIPTGQYLIIKR